MKKNLIIGSGKRVVESLIPALQILEEDIYIYSRNQISADNISSLFKIKIIENINNFKIKFERILIAIPPESILSIIKILSKYNLKNTFIYIDTPIIGPFQNIKLLSFEKYFKKILVTEDWLERPFFQITQNLIHKFKLGEVKRVEFHNSGFTYHALSVSRNLMNKKKIIMIKRKQVSINNNLISIILYGRKINMMYPINYTLGYITIYCSKGVITDNPRHKIIDNFFLIEKKISNNNIDFYLVNKKKYFFHLNKNEDFFLKLKLKNLNNISIEKKEKILSLITKFSKKDSLNYSIYEGIYDSMVFKILDKYKIFIDLVIGKYSLIFQILKLIKRL